MFAISCLFFSMSVQWHTKQAYVTEYHMLLGVGFGAVWWALSKFQNYSSNGIDLPFQWYWTPLSILVWMTSPTGLHSCSGFHCISSATVSFTAFPLIWIYPVLLQQLHIYPPLFPQLHLINHLILPSFSEIPWLELKLNGGRSRCWSEWGIFS